MKLTYFRSIPSNFGDALNETMWDTLLPSGFLDDDPSTLFLGIGSILDDAYPLAARKLVAGSGYGGYSDPPYVHDGSWRFAWVRGPRTAARLGLEPDLAIGDAAILVRETPLPPPRAGVDAVFMPHYQSLERGDWRAACALAGVEFLDPGAPAQDTIARIRGARVVIAEAMHGAIVADALRTPWIGILPFDHRHREKWFDWAEALGISLHRDTLRPSTLREAVAMASGRHILGRPSERLLANRLVAPVNFALRHRAAAALRRCSERVEPNLSSDAAIEGATDRMLVALRELVACSPGPHESKPAR